MEGGLLEKGSVLNSPFTVKHRLTKSYSTIVIVYLTPFSSSEPTLLKHPLENATTYLDILHVYTTIVELNLRFISLILSCKILLSANNERTIKSF